MFVGTEITKVENDGTHFAAKLEEEKRKNVLLITFLGGPFEISSTLPNSN